MNIDDADLLPQGGGSLRGPAAPPSRQYAAAFTQRLGAYLHPDSHWMPRGGELSTQGSRHALPAAGHGFEHEPVDGAERAAQHTAQDVGDFHAAAGRVRAALRPRD